MTEPIIAIRNPDMDLDRIHLIEHFLQELEVFRPDLCLLPEAIAAARYWVEVGQQLLEHEFVDTMDVFMAHRKARGKSINY